LRLLNRNFLKFNEVFCDLCGSNETTLWHSVFFLEKKFQYVRCLSCGLIYQNPSLSKESLFHIYDTIEYWNHKELGRKNSYMLNYFSYLSEKNQRETINKIRLKWIRPFLQDKAHILDLGCSDGSLVEVFCNAGFRAIGMDISSTIINQAKKKSQLELIEADFENEWPIQRSFDAITCYASLSNFSRPSRVFQQIQHHLKPGGYFFFNFGDYTRLASKILGSRIYLLRPTSTHIFSEKVIQKYCQKFGLRILELKTDFQIISLARVLGFLRMPKILKTIELLGIEKFELRMAVPTGYRVCAIRETAP
jgi:2-polyprenyl-3-methyl-5-hydroxy-6-metoxy-1,4-benzoquinol methylase